MFLMAKPNVPNSGYYCDWQTNTLYMSYRFSVKASDMDSNEFQIYDRIITRFPQMRVVIEEPKRRKSNYIPYNKMILYISYQENAKNLLAEFNEVRQKSNAYKNPYKHVYDWFTSKFLEYGKPQKKAS